MRAWCVWYHKVVPCGLLLKSASLVFTEVEGTNINRSQDVVRSTLASEVEKQCRSQLLHRHDAAGFAGLPIRIKLLLRRALMVLLVLKPQRHAAVCAVIGLLVMGVTVENEETLGARFPLQP